VKRLLLVAASVMMLIALSAAADTKPSPVLNRVGDRRKKPRYIKHTGAASASIV